LARATRELKLVQQREAVASAEQDALVKDRSITGAEKLLLLAHYDNVINVNENRRSTLETSQLTLRDQVALAQQIELPRVLEPAASFKEPAPTRRSHVVVGGILGLILGVLAALLWEPVARR